MWSLKRRERHGGNGATAVVEPPVPDTASEAELQDEIAELTVHNREQPSAAAARRLLALRNRLGVDRLLEPPDVEPEHPEPAFDALPAGEPLPELRPDQVTPELLRAGILRDGCLLVRGLIPREAARHFAAQIDRAYEERARHDRGQPPDGKFFSEFTPDPRFGTEMARDWVKVGGGILAADTPGPHAEMLELFAAAGIPRLVDGYLGEPPLVTAQKTTLRIAQPAVAGAWHQDGKFMGPVRALNLWLSLSRCGDESPGLDIVPRRLDGLVTTQTEEAVLDYAVSQRMADEVAGEKGVVRPIFEPGDALLFDELFLHKTGSDPAMPNPRYAIENWFFGASLFPREYAPLTV